MIACQREQGLTSASSPKSLSHKPAHLCHLLPYGRAWSICLWMGMSCTGPQSWLKLDKKPGCRALDSLLTLFLCALCCKHPTQRRQVGIVSSAFYWEEEGTLPSPLFKKKILPSLSLKGFGNRRDLSLYVSQLHKKSKYPVFQNLSS